MIKKIFIIAISSMNILWGQLISSGGTPALQLVQEVMTGYGIQIQSVTAFGSVNAYGNFNGSNSNIGFDGGVVLTTGEVTGPNGPEGPNDWPSAGIDNGTGGYTLLDNIVSPDVSFNATVFEISFIPTGDSIFLKYVFGSEEYLEYVGSPFKDLVAMFLSGPNPNGGNYTDVNIALTPFTQLPVSINNVNNAVLSLYYVSNESTVGSTVEYDGFTLPFIARAGVSHDSLYTLKIAVGDVSDGGYDSGVFIEAYSFTSGNYLGAEETTADDFVLYPNPANNYIQIQSPANLPIESYMIMDAMGRIVMTRQASSSGFTIDISSLDAGIYIITMKTDKGLTTKKIIKN
jgi:Secretion system C-terminal sorting domain